jgi:hypothetical protein
MNRRTLKKHCKRAMRILIEKHGYRAKDFQPADGGEALYAPPGMERRFVTHYEMTKTRFLKHGPLKGTPLLWTEDYWGEGDCALPSEVLREIEFWGSQTVEDLKAMCASKNEEERQAA